MLTKSRVSKTRYGRCPAPGRNARGVRQHLSDGLQILVSHTLLADNADGLWDVAGTNNSLVPVVVVLRCNPDLAGRKILCVVKTPSTTTVSSVVEAAKAAVGVNAIAMQAASNEGVAAG